MEVEIEEDEYAGIAHRVVDEAINNAFTQLTNEHLCDIPLEQYVSHPSETRRTPEVLPPKYKSSGGDYPNILWPKIDEFSPELGIEKIHEFIKTWHYDDRWQYCIDLIATEDLQYDTRYRYRVRWSVPTRRQPVPPVTASIYFTMEVSKLQPKDNDVNVYYVFESNRLVHRPGRSPFNAKGLDDIVESKELLISAIDF